ncbi:MAG: ribulose-phosphate 3-epimerase [Planctomycetota bacterium]
MPKPDLAQKPDRPLVLPSILAADFTRLGDDVADVLDRGADGIHVDVMDGHFVPNLSMGPPVMKSLRQRFPDVFFDVHLMVTNPEHFVAPFADAGADHVTFHIEATAGRKTHHEYDLIRQIKAAGCTAGVCYNPPTTAASVEHLLDEVDLVLAMSVHPGFGGQSFLPEVLTKIRKLASKIKRAAAANADEYTESGKSAEAVATTRLEIDGGVSPGNAAAVLAAGIDTVVAGSAVFNAPDRAAAIAAIKAAAED